MRTDDAALLAVWERAWNEPKRLFTVEIVPVRTSAEAAAIAAQG
jgi:hypothetical protein